MKVTVTATPDTYLLGGVVVRRWEGTTEAGTPVALFVASIRLPADHTEQLDGLYELTQPVDPSVN